MNTDYAENQSSALSAAHPPTSKSSPSTPPGSNSSRPYPAHSSTSSPVSSLSLSRRPQNIAHVSPFIQSSHSSANNQPSRSSANTTVSPSGSFGHQYRAPPASSAGGNSSLEAEGRSSTGSRLSPNSSIASRYPPDAVSVFNSLVSSAINQYLKNSDGKFEVPLFRKTLEQLDKTDRNSVDMAGPQVVIPSQTEKFPPLSDPPASSVADANPKSESKPSPNLEDHSQPPTDKVIETGRFGQISNAYHQAAGNRDPSSRHSSGGSSDKSRMTGIEHSKREDSRHESPRESPSEATQLRSSEMVNELTRYLLEQHLFSSAPDATTTSSMKSSSADLLSSGSFTGPYSTPSPVRISTTDEPLNLTSASEKGSAAAAAAATSPSPTDTACASSNKSASPDIIDIDAPSLADATRIASSHTVAEVISEISKASGNSAADESSATLTPPFPRAAHDLIQKELLKLNNCEHAIEKKINRTGHPLITISSFLSKSLNYQHAAAKKLHETNEAVQPTTVAWAETPKLEVEASSDFRRVDTAVLPTESALIELSSALFGAFRTICPDSKITMAKMLTVAKCCQCSPSALDTLRSIQQSLQVRAVSKRKASLPQPPAALSGGSITNGTSRTQLSPSTPKSISPPAAKVQKTSPQHVSPSVCTPTSSGARPPPTSYAKPYGRHPHGTPEEGSSVAATPPRLLPFTADSVSLASIYDSHHRMMVTHSQAGTHGSAAAAAAAAAAAHDNAAAVQAARMGAAADFRQLQQRNQQHAAAVAAAGAASHAHGAYGKVHGLESCSCALCLHQQSFQKSAAAAAAAAAGMFKPHHPPPPHLPSPGQHPSQLSPGGSADNAAAAAAAAAAHFTAAAAGGVPHNPPPPHYPSSYPHYQTSSPHVPKLLQAAGALNGGGGSAGGPPPGSAGHISPTVNSSAAAHAALSAAMGAGGAAAAAAAAAAARSAGKPPSHHSQFSPHPHPHDIESQIHSARYGLHHSGSHAQSENAAAYMAMQAENQRKSAALSMHSFNRSPYGMPSQAVPPNNGLSGAPGAGGGGGNPGGGSAVSSAAGQSRAPGTACSNCGGEAIYLCSGCRKIWYCSQDCQVKAWERHYMECLNSQGR